MSDERSSLPRVEVGGGRVADGDLTPETARVDGPPVQDPKVPTPNRGVPENPIDAPALMPSGEEDGPNVAPGTTDAQFMRLENPSSRPNSTSEPEQ